MRKTRALISIISGILTLGASAKEMGFAEMWQKVQSGEAKIRSIEESLEISKLNNSTVSRHWHPQLYISSTYAQSDDSGFSLFAKLQQRQIAPTDFDAAALNQSSQDYLFTTGLGVRVLLFEGFKYQKLSDASDYEVEAQQIHLANTKVQKKAELIEAYTGILIEKKYQQDLKRSQDRIQSTVKNYKLGKKSNPVGYSGILGLRALANKIEIKLGQSEAKVAQLRGEIESLVPELPMDWDIRTGTFTGILKDQVPEMSPEFLKNVSLQIQMREKMQKAMDLSADSLKSAYWPTLGAFAETQMVQGDRDSTDVNTLGVQLKWNLYDPATFNNHQVAKARQNQEKWITEEYRKRETAGRQTLYSSYPIAMKSLETMNTNRDLLEEQVQVSSKLFRSGVLNAINLSQVFSQYCDLLSNLKELEEKIVELHTQTLLMTAGRQ
ncbi:MAG: TolC family protein [Bdellovibrionales bacterium]|nr:TolC family protein [Bdellovibrionales bacterium]